MGVRTLRLPGVYYCTVQSVSLAYPIRYPWGATNDDEPTLSCFEKYHYSWPSYLLFQVLVHAGRIPNQSKPYPCVQSTQHRVQHPTIFPLPPGPTADHPNSVIYASVRESIPESKQTARSLDAPERRRRKGYDKLVSRHFAPAYSPWSVPPDGQSRTAPTYAAIRLLGARYLYIRADICQWIQHPLQIRSHRPMFCNQCVGVVWHADTQKQEGCASN